MLDVKIACLNGMTSFDTCMRQSSRCDIGAVKVPYLKALRSLYGLKESGREWFCTVIGETEKHGWIVSPYDRCILTHPDGAVKGIYFDDFALICKTLNVHKKMVAMLKSAFDMFESRSAAALIGSTMDRCSGGIRDFGVTTSYT